MLTQMLTVVLVGEVEELGDFLLSREYFLEKLEKVQILLLRIVLTEEILVASLDDLVDKSFRSSSPLNKILDGIWLFTFAFTPSLLLKVFLNGALLQALDLQILLSGLDRGYYQHMIVQIIQL